MSDKRLWLVTIHDDDWDYDNFESAAVWADTADDAERIVRSAYRLPVGHHLYPEGKLWIENPDWRLSVTPAPTEGVALIHWHAG